MKKPTGILGSYRVGVDGTGTATSSFTPITLPASKAEVERIMVDRFISSMNRRLSRQGEQFVFANPKANAEDDFDFTVTSSRGEAFLELMEIAPLQGPYGKAPDQYNVYDFAGSIFRMILEKSKRYPARMDKDLFLLCYVTHWTFVLSPSVTACLRYWCARTPLAFRAVFSFQPLDNEEGDPAWLFPRPPGLDGVFDPASVRNTVCLNMDSRKLELRGGLNEPSQSL